MLYFNSDPRTIAHPLCKPSVRDVYDVYNSIAFTINIPEESWVTMTGAGARPPRSEAFQSRSGVDGTRNAISDVDYVKPMLLPLFPTGGGPWLRAPPRAWAPRALG